MGYSVDLRERIVEAVRERRFSICEAASTFRVGHATVERYLRRFRESGELTPCKPPGRPSRVEGEQLGALKKQLEAHNELTLIEHCELWEHDTGMKLSWPKRALPWLAAELRDDAPYKQPFGRQPQKKTLSAS